MSETVTTRDLLLSYFAQRAELGQGAVFLREGSAGELLAELRSGGATLEARERSALPVAEASLEVGSAANAFEALRVEVLACARCRLAGGRTTVVFGEGSGDADLMVVGEAPGYEEDRSGRPFVGPAGRLLDKMLAAIGFQREEVFICNVLKCRPPGNRDPVADEVASCRPYLHKQVELVAPKAICAFGRFAAQTLLSTDQSLSRLRSAEHEFMGVPVVVTYHPAALLRNAQWKRPTWEDLKLLRRIYDRAGGRRPRGDNDGLGTNS